MRIPSMFSVAVLFAAGCTQTPQQHAMPRRQSQERASRIARPLAEGIHADTTPQFLSPDEPGIDQLLVVTLRVPVGYAPEITVHAEYAEIDTVRQPTPVVVEVAMKKTRRDARFDFFQATLPAWVNVISHGATPTRSIHGRPGVAAHQIAYEFALRLEGTTLRYGPLGLRPNSEQSDKRFLVYPDFETPDWMRGAVLYQIFVDRFFNGDPTNDVLTNEYFCDDRPTRKVENWHRLPDSERAWAQGGMRTCEFYGGDLEGVIRKLDYLAELGVDGIYLNPIHLSPTNHKYDAQDYAHVDPHFGVIVEDGGKLIDPEAKKTTLPTKYIARTTSPKNVAGSDAKFKTLCAQAKKRGIRIILDGVFNHTGAWHRWFDRAHLYPKSQGPGAHEAFDSPYHHFYQWKGDPGPTASATARQRFANNWPNNSKYEAWGEVASLPKLKFQRTPALWHEILAVSQQWLDWGASGWRLDAARNVADKGGPVNHAFWRAFRQAVKAKKPNAVILAEVYGLSADWLHGNEWDTIMNLYAFTDPLTWFLTGMDRDSAKYHPARHNNVSAFVKTMDQVLAELPRNSLMVAMNPLSDHDHSRFLTRTNHRAGLGHTAGAADEGVNLGIMKEAVLFQFTWMGAPTIYYGDEVGVAGWDDPDNRRTYPWPELGGKPNAELFAFHKAMSKLRKKISCIKNGSTTHLYANDEEIVYAFGRWDDNSAIAVALNNSDQQRTVTLPLWKIGVADDDRVEQVMVTDRHSFSTEIKAVAVSGGDTQVTIPPYGGMVLARQ